MPPLAVVKTILGLAPTDSDYAFVINTLRLPRVLVAFFVGLALAISGTILQGLARNPLATPGVIGLNAGAALAAVTLIVVFPQAPATWVPLAAFIGAMAVTALLYLLAWRGGRSPLRLILVGIGVSAMVGACTTLMITFGDINAVSSAMVWLVGSVYGRSWEQLWPLLPWLLLFVPLSCLLARDLNSLNLGDEVAIGVGNPVNFKRSLLLLTSVALAGAAVATAGTIGFVGFVAPHLARQLVGPAHEAAIPNSECSVRHRLASQLKGASKNSNSIENGNDVPGLQPLKFTIQAIN
ncbi:MAG: iron ABC transporter permease [Cyanothece sp. SIO1E1]|nr:iron ABC transporter permease [Cyanothece sp. SIO1E1]